MSWSSFVMGVATTVAVEFVILLVLAAKRTNK